MPNTIYSIAISAQAILDMHSLNNEGGEGNQIQTRMVNIVGADGKLYNVNAVSGDMFKHIQAEHMHRLALTANLPLSEGARSFNANRVNYDIDAQTDFVKEFGKARSYSEKLNVVLQKCAITDMEGILVTAGGNSLPRKSVVEFGWAVGLPEKVETDSFFHVKFEAERGQGKASVDDSGTVSGKQTPFHRPASSGVYAIVLNVEAARVGFNDISQSYAIDEKQREDRLKVLLESILYTFVEPAGAMRSTQNPHIVDFKGVLTISRDVVPAPCISPLKPEFEADIKQVAEAVNSLRPNAVEVKPFTSLGEFAQVMAELAKSAKPLALRIASQS